MFDAPERNAALARRWKLPFPVLSDPGGETILQPLELWNADERGGIALPALLGISTSGEELFRHLSRDFADRVHDDDVLQQLEALDLAPIEVPAPWQPGVAAPPEGSEELEGAFPEAAYVPLMNGNRFGAIALSRRIQHEESLREVQAHAAMSKSFVDAWQERRKS